MYVYGWVFIPNILLFIEFNVVYFVNCYVSKLYYTVHTAFFLPELKTDR
jgi:TM2 domain-containing membrane protein YozV